MLCAYSQRWIRRLTAFWLTMRWVPPISGRCSSMRPEQLPRRRAGAHREAAAYYRLALRVPGLPAEKRARFDEALSYECYLISEVEELLRRASGRWICSSCLTNGPQLARRSAGCRGCRGCWAAATTGGVTPCAQSPLWNHSATGMSWPWRTATWHSCRCWLVR